MKVKKKNVKISSSIHVSCSRLTATNLTWATEHEMTLSQLSDSKVLNNIRVSANQKRKQCANFKCTLMARTEFVASVRHT